MPAKKEIVTAKGRPAAKRNFTKSQDDGDTEAQEDSGGPNKKQRVKSNKSKSGTSTSSNRAENLPMFSEVSVDEIVAAEPFAAPPPHLDAITDEPGATETMNEIISEPIAAPLILYDAVADAPGAIDVLRSGQLGSMTIPFLSSMVPGRFKTYLYPNNDSLDCFQYNIRKSFSTLLNEVIKLIHRACRLGGLLYVGNVGAGKSHNLAALVFYLRTIPRGTLSKNIDVVYIPSCLQLFQADTRNLRRALIETFPAEADQLRGLETWDGLVKFVEQQPRRSILFIFDDYNYVIGEAKLLSAEQGRRVEFRQKLDTLACDQYQIQAISAFSESLMKLSSSDTALAKVTLYGGLTDDEWRVWKQGQAFFKDLSDEDEEKLKDFTGLIPLYLKEIAGMDGDFDLESRIDNFFLGVGAGSTILSNLKRSSENFIQLLGDDKTFYDQMSKAVCEVQGLIDERYYDHRYFYCDDSDHTLKPVCGFVRKWMSRYLFQSTDASVTFKKTLKDNWEALKNNPKPSVRGEAFECLALFKLLDNISAYFPDVEEVQLHFFDGKFPGQSELTAFCGTVPVIGSGQNVKCIAHLYIPTDSQYPYVDAILRVLVSTEIVHIYGIQITLQTCEQHKKSLKFFLKEYQGNTNDRVMLGQKSLAEQFVRYDDDGSVIEDQSKYNLMWIIPTIEGTVSYRTPRIEGRTHIAFKQLVKSLQIKKIKKSRSKRTLQ